MSATSQASREIIERFVEIVRTGKTARLGEIIAPEFRYRRAAPVGVEGVAAGVLALHAGFTEVTCSLEQCVSEEDWAAYRFLIAGRHTGVFAGRAATGHHITWAGADFVRLRQGKIVELWPVQESLPLMEGIGAVMAVK
jgi:predicted ester cyclase